MKIIIEQGGDENYPDYVLDGVRESIKQADEGLLRAYTSIKDLLEKASPTDILPE